ncbi:MAG: TolC family protein [Candidatus Nitrohelix vancouverensis]|uniref:TolC family protein n=1 Tax=Candidatus Nitrohelix vancouverensis TaxID=2705534 RepID=A0A7T0C0C6_9BACT|nr:MAG: TolC family protein [Candidatus Nitrohelix vancouverensis]
MRSFSAFLLFTLALFTPIQAVGGEPHPFKEVLQNFISTALQSNPGVLEIQSRIKASKEVPSQASSLDDPMLRFGLMNMPTDSFDFSQEMMTQKTVTVSQALPFPGKLALRAEIAEKDVFINERDLDEVRLGLVRSVKHSFFELCFVLTATEITLQNKKLLEQFVSIAETKYSVGKGIQQDVLKAQVELTKILDQLIVLEKLASLEKARLNTLMNRLPQEPLTIPHGIAKSSFKFSVEELQAMADANRPLLSKIQIVRERYETSKRLAEKEFYPNFNVGVQYGQREDGLVSERADMVSAFVGINIPIWFESKQSRKVAETAHQVNMLREAYNKEKNEIYFKVKELVDKEAQITKTLQLIQTGILPQAKQSLESALAGYSVDKVDFLTLLSNQVTLFNWDIRYHRELADYEKNLAEIENVVGKNLF